MGRFFTMIVNLISLTVQLVIWSVRGMRHDAQMAADNVGEKEGKKK